MRGSAGRMPGVLRSAAPGWPRSASCVTGLGVIGVPDAAVGPGRAAGSRLRGRVAAEVDRVGAELAGEDFLIGLDRQRADAAGQQLAPLPGLSSATAAGVARRITAGQWKAVETGLAAVTQRMLERGCPAVLGGSAGRRARSPSTLSATDVGVSRPRKRGVAYNQQGQRAGRPHVAAWAETETCGRRPGRRGLDDLMLICSSPPLRRALAAQGPARRPRRGARRRRAISPGRSPAPHTTSTSSS